LRIRHSTAVAIPAEGGDAYRKQPAR
jgi:hypothetical protein